MKRFLNPLLVLAILGIGWAVGAPASTTAPTSTCSSITTTLPVVGGGTETIVVEVPDCTGLPEVGNSTVVARNFPFPPTYSPPNSLAIWNSVTSATVWGSASGMVSYKTTPTEDWHTLVTFNTVPAAGTCGIRFISGVGDVVTPAAAEFNVYMNTALSPSTNWNPNRGLFVGQQVASPGSVSTWNVIMGGPMDMPCSNLPSPLSFELVPVAPVFGTETISWPMPAPAGLVGVYLGHSP